MTEELIFSEAGNRYVASGEIKGCRTWVRLYPPGDVPMYEQVRLKPQYDVPANYVWEKDEWGDSVHLVISPTVPEEWLRHERVYNDEWIIEGRVRTRQNDKVFMQMSPAADVDDAYRRAKERLNEVVERLLKMEGRT